MFCAMLHEPGRVGLHVAVLIVLPIATMSDGDAPALIVRLATGLSVASA